MRTVLLLSLLFLCTTQAQSQFETGKRLIGGTLFFNTNSSSSMTAPASTQRSTNTGISFSLQRFKSPLVIAGGGISYFYNHSRYNPPISGYQINNHNVGVFVNRAYLQPLARKLYLSIGGNIGGNYSYLKSSNTATDYSETKSFSISAGAGLGLWYQLSQRFVLSGELSNLLAISYGSGKQKIYSGAATVQENKLSSFGFTTGLSGFSLGSFGIGVKYLLK